MARRKIDMWEAELNVDVAVENAPSHAYLCNGRVAWFISGWLARYYNARIYLPPDGWVVQDRLPKKYRYRGGCGELRAVE